MDAPQSSDKFYFTHMEVGFTTRWGERVIPNPEWSGPSNNRALDEVNFRVSPSVIDQTATKVLQILDRKQAKGMFLAFPYFAERHQAVLRNALAHNHVVGIHMHENWKLLTQNNTVEDVTLYIESEKERLDNAVGTKVTVFSYGPGIQFDTIGGKERPPYYGALTDDEKRKLFQAIKNAGFNQIQTAREYEIFLPPELKLLSGDLIGIPHSFEWHTERDELRQVIDSIDDKIR